MAQRNSIVEANELVRPLPHRSHPRSVAAPSSGLSAAAAPQAMASVVGRAAAEAQRKAAPHTPHACFFACGGEEASALIDRLVVRSSTVHATNMD